MVRPGVGGTAGRSGRVDVRLPARLDPSPGRRAAAHTPLRPAGEGGHAVRRGGGLGLYDGEHSPAGIETAAKWLGSPSSIKYAMDFVDATNWSQISDPWQLPNWKGSPYTMVWGVPMVPCGTPSSLCATNVSDFNAVAQGADNGYYEALARNLVAAGFGSSYIRLGWEFNATWMGWSVCKQDGSGPTSWADDFVPAFRNIVTSMRSVSGANFKFIWNPVEGSNVSCFINLANFYPGNAYVDVVALDVYDGISSTVDHQRRALDRLPERRQRRALDLGGAHRHRRAEI